MTDSNEQNNTETGKKQVQDPLFSRMKNWLHSDAFKCILMDIAAFLMILIVFFFVCVPKKYDLTVNSIAPETIKATKDITDEWHANNLREIAAAAAAADTQNVKYNNINLLVLLEAALDDIRAVHQYGRSLLDAPSAETAESDLESSETENETVEPPSQDIQEREFSDEEIDQAAAVLNVLTLSPAQCLEIMNMSQQEIETMASAVTTAVEAELTDKIFREDSTDKINESKENLLKNEDLSPYLSILPELLEVCIGPNFIIDQEATDEARQKAMEKAMQDVVPEVYLQGRIIIREGDPVEEYQLSMLSSLGLLNDQNNDFPLYGGAAVTVLIAMICLLMSLKLLSASILTDVRQMAVILIVLFLSVGVAAIAHLLPNQYVIPLAMGAILGTVLIGYRAGICITLTLSLLFASLTSGNASSTFFDVVLLMSMTVAEGILSIWFLKGHPQRVRVLLAGLLSAVLGFAVIFGFKWLTSSISLNVLSVGAWSFAGGILSGVLAVAFQPALEQLFRLATPSRLLELTNPNQPLMKRLMIEAPGTYHHSIIVANLAEAAADKIHANPYLARAGAYYHDIGKLKRPGYFKENQNGDNPHERTDPYVSAAILISHTMDGVLLAQKEHMPNEVQAIIQQHHGVTPVMFFYHKALQMSDGTHVDIDEFRYSGPKPNTKESAIVMLADTIEAAVRSMKDPTPKGIDQFIERLVRGKLEDGQLSDSPLSLSDIDQICDAFSGILKGVYHERIEYPTVPHYAGKTLPVPESVEKKSGNVPDGEPVPAARNDPPSDVERPRPEQSAEKGKEDSSNDA